MKLLKTILSCAIFASAARAAVVTQGYCRGGENNDLTSSGILGICNSTTVDAAGSGRDLKAVNL